MRPVSSAPWFKAVLPFVVGIVGLIVAVVLANVVSGYLVYLGITVIVATIAIMGLGIVTGSAGMIALCQLTFAAVGAWVVAGLNYISNGMAEAAAETNPDATVAPFLGGFMVWLVLGGVAGGIVGILIGLPALRLRGVNLAVVTLGFAAAADVTLVMIQFPGVTEGVMVTRPEEFGGIFSDDKGFFLFAVIVLVICAIAIYFLQNSRWGSSWKSVAFSERGTAAVGQRVAGAKLTAFAVSAALAGLAGGLIAGQVGQPFASSFTPIQSLALYVLAIMAGSHLIDMAIFGGLLWVVVPELLKRWGIPQDWAFVIFGGLGVQALTTRTNLGQGIRNLWWKRRSVRDKTATTTLSVEEIAALTASSVVQTPLEERAPVLQVENLSVAFGNVKALDGVTLTVREHSIMGLIGPNGAGKSTFVDAITGFLPQHTGTVTLGGRALGGMSPTKRARLGLRRTFQQDRVPPSLTIDSYARFVARRTLKAGEIDEVLDFFGCPPARTRLVSVDVGTRRLVEVAANVLAQPKVLLLDEPAAGLSHDEHVELGHRLLQVPARFGTSIVLIEHDLEMVRSVCETITVLDFGQVIASGPQAEVLANPDVLKAYMGETELTHE